MNEVHVVIPYLQFTSSNIRFQPPIRNKYFDGTFSQLKYKYGPFTIYNPILLPPDHGNISEWLASIEMELLRTYTRQNPENRALTVQRKPFSNVARSAKCGLKISGVWTTAHACGLNYVWVNVGNWESLEGKPSK